MSSHLRRAPTPPHDLMPDAIALLTRVGCHVYSGELLPDGRYREHYTGPGAEALLGGPAPDGVDHREAWDAAVHPDDLDDYLHAGLDDEADTVCLEYRLVGRDGVVRWVMDQMVVRGTLADGRRVVDGIVIDISARKQAEEALRRLAHSDPLTGLANRPLLTSHIDEAIARSTAAGNGPALLLLDLDGFKSLNDTFGHETGDELLEAVAVRLSECLREQDLAARLGGDEFALLLEAADMAQAVAVGERVLAAIAEPFPLRRAEVVVTASIGVVHTDQVRSTHELLRDADVAMYRAKAEGRNRLVVFEPSMQQSVARRLALESQLRTATAQGQFELHYQPFVNLDTGRIVGVEALIRWLHPERGLLLPAEFIAVAEETGLIVPLGRWIIEAACRQAAAWQSQDRNELLSLAVNLSPRQLHDPELVTHVARCLATSGLPASALTIEITENLLLSDTDLAGERIGELRALGVQVAVDDFGTGYSSLAYLRRYPVDVLKIDRTFVSPLVEGTRSAALVRSIIDLASALDVDTVAEGVEAPEQAAALVGLGCHVAQGFYFCQPQPAAAIDRLVRGQRLPVPSQVTASP